MDDGSEYRLEWYYSDSTGWYGWYYDDIEVNTTDDVPDGIHFNMTMDAYACSAYFYAQVYNLTDGQNTSMYSRTRYIDGPCLMPVSLLVDGEDALEMDDMDLSLGVNNMTWSFDHLETGVDYRLEWYYSNDSTWNGWYYEYFTYNGSNDVHWTIDMGVFDCYAYAYAYLYYDSNGTSAGPSQDWNFNAPDCADVWAEVVDEDGEYADSDDLQEGSHNLSWVIHDLPEGYDYALEMRVYENGYYQSYDYVLTNESGNLTVDFTVDIGPAVCDLRLEASIYYLQDASSNDWEHITGFSWYFYPNCDEYQTTLPYDILTDADGDGNYTVVNEWDNVGGDQTIPFAIDASGMEGTEYRMEYSWHTGSSSQYFSWQDITDSNSVFYFDVPVSEYDCEVRIYAYLQYYDFRGYWQYMDSRNTYFETDCLDPGNVSLVMDGVGEVWDDWGNLNNGTNDMMWELTDLNAGTEYALDWYVRVNDDFVLYEHQTWQATSDSGDLSWSFSIDNSTTCNVEIRYRLFVDSSEHFHPELDGHEGGQLLVVPELRRVGLSRGQLRQHLRRRSSSGTGPTGWRTTTPGWRCPRARPTSRCTSRT